MALSQLPVSPFEHSRPAADAQNLGWLARQPKRAAHRLEHRKSIVLT